MNILFVLPFHRSYVIQPNLGLGYLAAVARRAGHNPVILDGVRDRIGIDKFASIIRTEDFDAVGFHMFSQDYDIVKKMSRTVKKVNPEIYTIAGGPHPTGDPDGVIEDFPDIDFVFSGEAEKGLPVLLNLLSDNVAERSAPSAIKELYWKNKEVSPVRTEISDGQENKGLLFCPPVENLDGLPFPAWDLMRPDSYPEAPHGAFIRQFPVAPIVINRGCPFECTFCAGAGHLCRKRSIGNVMEEIRFLDKTYGVKEFLIEDENFILHKELVRAFCESMLRSGRGYTWSCPTGISLAYLDLEELRLMEKAGCHSVSVGVEFGSQRIHDITKKKLTLEIIREKLALLAKTNIRTTGFFLLGIPGETAAEIGETVKLALSLPLHRIQVSNFMPLPGSRIWKDLKSEDRLRGIRYEKFFVHDVAYAPGGVTKVDIKRLQRKAYISFYFRWKIMKSVLSDIRSFNHFKYLVKRFLDALF